MEIAYIIHKSWPSERPKEPELSEKSLRDHLLSKAMGRHKSLSQSGHQHPQQRSPYKKRKYLRTQKINSNPEQQKVTSKSTNLLLHSYVYRVLICSQEFIKNSILSNLSRTNCTKTITKTYGLPTILQLSSVLFWVSTIFSKGFANILDALAIQNRHDMHLPVFAAETKMGQSLVGLPASILELFACSSILRSGLRCDACTTSFSLPSCPSSPSTGSNRRLPTLTSPPPGFRTETRFLSFYIFPNWPCFWPFLSSATGWLPIPITQLLSTHFPVITSQTQETAATKRQFVAQMWHRLNNPDHILAWCIIFSFAFSWPWL